MVLSISACFARLQAEVMPICNTKNEFVFGGLNAQCGGFAPVGLRDRGAGVSGHCYRCLLCISASH